jgi:hypothetical protein
MIRRARSLSLSSDFSNNSASFGFLLLLLMTSFLSSLLKIWRQSFSNPSANHSTLLPSPSDRLLLTTTHKPRRDLMKLGKY